MHITYVHQTPIPAEQANVIHVIRMCQAFAANGHEVTLIAPAGRIGGSDTQSVDIHRYYGVAHSFSILRWPRPDWIRGNRRVFASVAAVFGWFRPGGLVYSRCSLAADYATRLGLPTIFEAHTPPGPAAIREGAALRRILQRRSLLRIVVISQALREAFERELPLAQRLLFVAHDGANAFEDAFENQKGSSWNDSLATGKELRAVYAGHLYAGKGMETLMAAAPLSPDVKFEIIGGTTEDIEYWRKAARHRESVAFLGFLPPASIPERLRAADVLLAPYQRKVVGADRQTDIAPFMSPLKIFEYMAAGRAIIASNLPVLREVLTHRETALLCPPDDPAAWSEALRLLRSDPELRLRLGRNARELLEREFTWKRRAERILEGLA